MRKSIFSALSGGTFVVVAAIAALAPVLVFAEGPSGATPVNSAKFVDFLRVGMPIQDVRAFLGGRFSIPHVDFACVELNQVLYERYLFEDASSVVITYQSAERALENKIASFEVIQFEDLKPRIGDAQFDLVRAIHLCPLAKGEHLRPIQLIRAVNALRAAGKEEAIKALRAYFDLKINDELDGMNFFDRFRYGIRDDRAIFVGRLLFVRTDGKMEMPEFRNGAPSPDVARIGPEWPLYPLVLENDIPFCVVGGYVLFGQPASVMDDLPFYEKQCIVRKAPLAPRESPIKIVERFLQSDQWRAAERNSKGGTEAARELLQLQAISAIDHLVPAKEVRIDNHYSSASERRKAIDWVWNSLVHDPHLQNVVWDEQKQMFVISK